MKKLSHLLLALLLTFGPGVVWAKDAVAPAYFDPATLDPKAFLPNPPTDNSDATEKEIEIILQMQADRTPQQLARIELEKHYNVFVFTNVIGAWFTNETVGTMPLTNAILARAMETAKPIVATAKGDWNRPRPFLMNSRVYPPIERPKDESYPSEHSTRATLDALVLAELMPDQAVAILRRGQEVGDDGVIAGVQFPSDVLAGRKLGRVIFDRLMVDKQFQDDLKAAKAEVVAELKKVR